MRLWEMERLASERESHFRRCYMLAAGNRWIPWADMTQLESGRVVDALTRILMFPQVKEPLK